MTEGGQKLFSALAAQVGALPLPIRAVDLSRRQQWSEELGVQTISLRLGGSLVLVENGVIEPVTAAFQRAAFEAPEFLATFIEGILGTAKPALPILYRL